MILFMRMLFVLLIIISIYLFYFFCFKFVTILFSRADAPVMGHTWEYIFADDISG